ncbi:MAG: ABC transporter ATP-binding protein [Candidatus Odinarchaeota archaeon]
MSQEELLRVENLFKYFPVKGGFFNRTVGHLHAVDDVTFGLSKGRTIGVVGESGCGKTTLGRCLIRLLKPTSGKIFFDGVEITEFTRGKEFKKFRQKIQMVFQDPYASLDPRVSIGTSVGEPLAVNGYKKQEIGEKVLELLETVGLGEQHLDRFPHEFSGGQRQRICVARALILGPKFVILDEPTASLDVSVQAQVLNLLKKLQKQFDLTYMFISHDLSVVKHMSDLIMVMYLGKVMEIGPKNLFFREELHPYTRALFSAIPLPDPEARKTRILLTGDVPSPIDPKPGCRFRDRCQYALDICEETPELQELEKDHWMACHRAHELTEMYKSLNNKA